MDDPFCPVAAHFAFIVHYRTLASSGSRDRLERDLAFELSVGWLAELELSNPRLVDAVRPRGVG